MRRDRLEDRTGDNGRLLLAWTAPDACDPRSGLLSLAAALLADGHPSRLSTALVDGSGPARTVSASNNSEIVCGQFRVTAVLAPGGDFAEAERRLRATVATFLKEPIDIEHFERLRLQLLRSWARAGDSLNGKAGLLTTGQLLFGDPGAFKQEARRLAEVCAADVHAAAVEWLACEPYVLEVRPFGSPQAAGTGVPRDQPPAVNGMTRAATPFDFERLTLTSGLPVLHAPGLGGGRVLARLVFDRGLADLDEADRPLALLFANLPRLGLNGRDAAGLESWLVATGLQLRCWVDAGAFSVEVEAATAAAWPDIKQLLTDILANGPRPRALRRRKPSSGKRSRRLRNTHSGVMTLRCS